MSEQIQSKSTSTQTASHAEITAQQFADAQAATAKLGKKLDKATSALAEIQSNWAIAKKTTDTKAADPLDEQKHAAGASEYDALVDEMKSLRSQVETLNSPTPEAKAENAKSLHIKASEKFVRLGIERMNEDEIKALSSGVPADGGYTVYNERSNQLTESERNEVPMRRLANVMGISSNELVKPKLLTDAASGWIGETAARPETTAPTFGQSNFPVMEIYAKVLASQNVLDDNSINMEAWLNDHVRTLQNEAENTGFTVGTGAVNKQPEGFLAYAGGFIDNSLYTSGKIGTIATGAAGAFGASGYDNIVDLWGALKTGYARNAAFTMNRLTRAEVMKIKDANGDPIFEKPTENMIAGGMLGVQIETMEDMPDIAANSYAIALADFKKGYLIVDRFGFRVIRDPYSNKPFVEFYITKRVGGGVDDEQAIKLLRFGV